jgi:hypothetical protein
MNEVATVPLAGAFFTREGLPTPGLGGLLIRTINALTARSGGAVGAYRPLTRQTVAELEALAPTLTEPAIGFCTDEAGGACPAYYEPVSGEWRRFDTNAQITT